MRREPGEGAAKPRLIAVEHLTVAVSMGEAVASNRECRLRHLPLIQTAADATPQAVSILLSVRYFMQRYRFELHSFPET